MASDLPSRIDRATLDRVLKRAAELQAASGDSRDSLSEAETVALGKEVGLPPELVQQALIEERVRVNVEGDQGMLDRTIAPADIMAQRVVQGTPAGILAALTLWMERYETLVVQRAQPDRVTFEPMEGFARGMRRIAGAFHGSARPFLDKAELVRAVVTPLDSGFCHVALAASARRSRAGLIAGGSALALVGAAFGAVFVAVGAPLVIGAAVFTGGAAGGFGVARIFRRRATRIALGLARALDELERNPAVPRGAAAAAPTGALARGVGQVVREISAEVRRALHE